MDFGINDNDFIRGEVPITKEEVRVIAISKLKLTKDCNVLDIGAGTGSITVEIARLIDGMVYAIEKEDDAIDLIQKNSFKFGVSNVKIIQGEAPYVLDGITGFSKVVIGGSGGNLDEILQWVDKNILPYGNIVILSITLDTLTNANVFFKNKNYETEITQVSINKLVNVKTVSMFKSQNPIFIICAKKGE
ncbi:MAG: precorrin-6Y C5,15-methyltransferase (decarboxylating) subunit CbiT [Spirochaetes bacterium GWC1_27_15]|nr:MAG: precorrin-6Y C5,15-methyltransferase (decarboxylating) subunit CbiT [Spirochaetes bacterium GWB1_27_13]OHD27345.1 MAG: precorrin-6Y C5,15-methyltransferase (decarboxylating) subunit CbiT [Spirochaetes bacterium GWC1_27_15]